MAKTKEDKKALKEQLEKEAADLHHEQAQLLVMEKELEQNTQFKKYLALKNKINNQDALFREAVKNEMIKNDIPKLKGDWGSITLVTRETYKVTDENKVPAEYKEEKTVIVVDTKAIKEDYTLTGVLPAGVQVNKSQHVLIKGAK